MRILKHFRFPMIVGLAGLLLAACTPAPAQPTASATQPVRLIPYHIPTLSPTAPVTQPGGLSLPTSTVTPTATPTPFLHVLVKDDTLLGLALQYGVSLEAIKTANPQVNPNLLIIGNSVVIPIQATPLPTLAPSPTPVAARLAAPRCYPTGDGGLWCFVLATNNQPFALENLAARIRLAGPDGQNLGKQTAILPLNRLPPGASLPLMAFFPPPVEASAVPSAVQTDSLAIPAADTRYLTTTLQIENVAIGPNGLQADVQGSVGLLPGSSPASVVWLAAVAYDADGQVVGVRKWEAAEILPPAGSLPFTITVYSLGPAIARLDAVVEARP
jgi:LysM repeat protein